MLMSFISPIINVFASELKKEAEQEKVSDNIDVENTIR